MIRFLILFFRLLSADFDRSYQIIILFRFIVENYANPLFKANSIMELRNIDGFSETMPKPSIQEHSHSPNTELIDSDIDDPLINIQCSKEVSDICVLRVNIFCTSRNFQIIFAGNID